MQIDLTCTIGSQQVLQSQPWSGHQADLIFAMLQMST